MSIILGYNLDMHRTFLLRKISENTIIIISLMLVIFFPRVLLGWLYLKQAQDYASQSSYLKAAQTYEDSARRLWWMKGLYEQAAHSAWLVGDSLEALRLFLLARENDGLTSSGKLALGDVYSRSGDTPSAVEAWESVGFDTPDSSAAFSRLAIANREMKNYSLAMEYWQAVLKIEPQNGVAHYYLGLFLMTVLPEEALPELMLALSLDPQLDEHVQVLQQGLNQASLQEDPTRQLVISGQSLASIDAWDLALQAFISASLADPDFSEAWAWQGEANQHLGEDGLPALKKALVLDRNSILSLALNGLYYRRQDQIEQAWSVYIRAATLDPSNSAWQQVLGELSAQKGNLIDALKFYQKAVELSPQNPVAWRALALFCVQYNVSITDIGMQAALKGLKLEPANWRSQDVMGQVLLATGDLNKSSQYFNQSIDTSPNQPDSYLHLGYLKLLQDQRDDAYHNLVKARQLDPDGSIGMQAQRLLDQYFP